MKSSKERRLLLIVYILGIYILFQVFWWGFSLIQSNRELYEMKTIMLGVDQGPVFEQKVWMIVGEGGVFVLLLAIGFYQIQKNIQRELRLARMEKTFLLSVTHELKTPIAAVKLFIETMRARKLSEEQTQTILRDALKETTRLQDLSENILLATRLDQQRDDNPFTEVPFSTLVNNEVLRFKDALNTNRHFIVQVQEQLVLSGDGHLLRAAVFNLIENAVKYSPDNSHITIEVKKSGNTIIFSCTDEGPGIPPEEHNRVFDKFYRLGNEETRKHKGTGLGLYITKNAVRLHNGAVSISQPSTGGTCLTIQLPLQ